MSRRNVTAAALALVAVLLVWSAFASGSRREGETWYTVQKTATRYPQTHYFPSWCCAEVRAYRDGFRVDEKLAAYCGGWFRGRKLWADLHGCATSQMLTYLAEGLDPVPFTIVYR